MLIFILHNISKHHFHHPMKHILLALLFKHCNIFHKFRQRNTLIFLTFFNIHLCKLQTVLIYLSKITHFVPMYLLFLHQVILLQILQLSRKLPIPYLQILHLQSLSQIEHYLCIFLHQVNRFFILSMDNEEEINIARPEQAGSQTRKMDQVREILREYADFKESELNDFTEAISDPKTNRVLGAIFGAIIGDALGAYCEFLTQIPPYIEAEVMQMPGGGTFGTILPGQYTDDNQLAYHLLQGLLQFNQLNDIQPQKPNLIKHIALEYIRWVGNNPFDIGNTCSSAIGYLTDCKADIEQSDLDPRLMEDILKVITDFNSDSQANGSLMRIVPMAAFMSLLELDPMKEQLFIKDQIKLTHPNKHLQIAGLCWVRLLTLLMNRESNDKETLESIINSVQSDPQFGLLREWFTEAHQPYRDSMPGSKKMGWAKIAFSYGLKFLVYLCEGKLALTEKDLYKNWIKRVIMLAGDTDTNACIAGGLVGSIIGFQQLPIEYLEKIFKAQYTVKNTNTSMPREYEPSNFLRCVLTLINKSKAHLNRQKANPTHPQPQ